MKRWIMTVCVFAGISGNAQFVVDNSNDIAQIVDSFTGQGIEVSNVNFYGQNEQIGLFSYSGNQFSFEEGLIMSTGNVDTLPGPNSSESSGSDFGNNDADNSAEVAFMNPFDNNSSGKYNVAYLEFDFVTTTRDLSFEYVFASEEYPEFVNGGVNDAFVMLLSGPGIMGPYENNSVNIALIPGTTTPISIDNVNPNTNSEYYVDNNTNNGQQYMSFDGYTVDLTASFDLPSCDETYHIKIAICDIGDAIYDSAVMLKANSLSSGIGSAVSITDVTTCPNEQILLSPVITNENNMTFSWDNGAYLGRDLQVLTGIYSESHILTISDDCGNFEDYPVEIIIDCPISEANIFTPNGDNMNDIFNFKNLVHYPDSRVEIYNRWGRLVYEEDNIVDGWNGKIKGENADATSGTYYYLITAPTGDVWRGFITLLR